jgi:thiol-disulfide isomerase/thioredoxin
MSIIKSTIKTFWKSNFNRYLLIVLLLIGTVTFFVTEEESVTEEEGLVVNFFYLPTCPHCADQKPIFEELKNEMIDVHFYSHDASSAEGSQLFYSLSSEAKLDTSKLAVPTIFVGKYPLVGVHTKEQIKTAIEKCEETCSVNGIMNVSSQGVSTSFNDFELPFLGRTDLTKFSIPALAVVLGLIDGFNPCAMWVLVYLIALLVGIKDKRKIWVIVGSFVLASGILYFLLMAAWLNVFLLIGYMKIVTMIIGLIALGGGIISIREYIATKGALTCDVGDEESHEKTIGKIKDIISKPLSIAIVSSIVVLAFLVNSIEFVCSSAIPAVFTQILAISNLSVLQNYGYILLYDLFFMLDDLIIFGLAALAINSSFGDKYAKYSKLIGGIIMTVLGFVLVFMPHLLR